MSKYVVRTDLSRRRIGKPLQCNDVSEIFYSAAAPTIEECVQMLLAGDEVCLSGTKRRPIMRGVHVVGYIEISDDAKTARPSS